MHASIAGLRIKMRREMTKGTQKTKRMKLSNCLERTRVLQATLKVIRSSNTDLCSGSDMTSCKYAAALS